jgi:hypothetical protein
MDGHFSNYSATWLKKLSIKGKFIRFASKNCLHLPLFRHSLFITNLNFFTTFNKLVQ